jgi:uncharacterized protein YuzE
MTPFTTIDYQADAVYIELRPMDDREAIAVTIQVTPSIYFDWTADGTLQGIEFLTVEAWREVASNAAIKAMTFGRRTA